MTDELDYTGKRFAPTWHADAITWRTERKLRSWHQPVSIQESLELANLCEEIAFLYEQGLNFPMTLRGFCEDCVF